MTQKQRSLATLAVLVVLAAAAGGAAWWSARHDSEKKATEQKTARLFDFDKSKVTALAVTAKGETTQLTKTADGWRITQPVDAPADVATVDEILTRLNELERHSVVDEHGGDLAKFGLEPPVAHVVATYPGGTADVTLGGINDYVVGQYARVGGSDAVLLLESTHDAALARTPFDLREKRLAVFDQDSVKSVEVEAAPDRYTLEHTGSTWKVTAPKAEPADESVVQGILGVAQNARATSIADEKGEDLAKFGLNEPVARIAITLKNGKRIEVKFGQVGEGREQREYAQSSASPLVAQVPLEAHAHLHVSPEVLEDKTVAHLDRDAVAAAQFISGTGDKILVQRHRTTSDGGEATETWSELAPKLAPAQRWRMSSILYAFANLKASKVVGEAPADAAKFELDKAVREVSFQDSAGANLLDVKFGRTEKTEVYVQNAADPRIFSVEQSRVAQLPKSSDDLLDVLDGGAK